MNNSKEIISDNHFYFLYCCRKGKNMERYKMDRIKEMKDFLHDTEEILVKERIDKIKMICMREENIKKEIQTIVDKLTMGKAGGCVAISFLRSSYITGSHEVCIAYYMDEPFVEENLDCEYYSLRPFFEGIEDELQYMIKELRNKYIRIMASEIEEIRKWFMDEIYTRLGSTFKMMLADMQVEEDINVFYGNYMDELELLRK